jgi:Excreted virulence factor EspC, type VII ESX diderm
MLDLAGTGFRVSPDGLISAASTFDWAADHWRGVLGELAVRVSEGACGTGDGEVTEVLTRLNGELGEAGQALSQVLAELAATLQVAAGGYVDTDEGVATSFDTTTFPELAP